MAWYAWVAVLLGIGVVGALLGWDDGELLVLGAVGAWFIHRLHQRMNRLEAELKSAVEQLRAQAPGVQPQPQPQQQLQPQPPARAQAQAAPLRAEAVDDDDATAAAPATARTRAEAVDEAVAPATVPLQPAPPARATL
ncbi:MAG: hypothetical protein ACOVQT_01945, partial [Rubrivivax sp.]